MDQNKCFLKENEAVHARDGKKGFPPLHAFSEDVVSANDLVRIVHA